MLILITYDVNTSTLQGRRRLTRIAKICCNYGQRVQNSVFECDLNTAELVTVKARLLEIIDEKNDSIRFYDLGQKYSAKIEQYGRITSYDPEGELFL